MSEYLFSGVLIVSSIAIGLVIYYFAAAVLKRRATVSFKRLKVNLGLLKRPLRFLIPSLCLSPDRHCSADSPELRALMSAADSPTSWNLRCEVREKLLEFLQQRFSDCLPRIRVERHANKSA